MAIETKETPQSSTANGIGHERSDAHVAWIFGIVAGLFVAGFGVHFLLAAMLNQLRKGPSAWDLWQPVQRPATQIAAKALSPKLQVSPAADLASFRATEDAELTRYGWIDKSAGVVRIPIDRAMELVLEAGLPARTGSNDFRAGPSSYELELEKSLPKNQKPGGAK
jgi:hypothetical protein